MNKHFEGFRELVRLIHALSPEFCQFKKFYQCFQLLRDVEFEFWEKIMFSLGFLWKNEHVEIFFLKVWRTRQNI